LVGIEAFQGRFCVVGLSSIGIDLHF